MYVGVIGVVAHAPSISHLSQVGGCGQVLLLMLPRPTKSTPFFGLNTSRAL